MAQATQQSASLTETAHWEEWVRLCAIGKCAPETAMALRRFGRERFARCLALAAGAETAAGACPDARACFHLFETWCTVGSGRNASRGGRRYKQWLAARAGQQGSAALYESGASLLIRDVARAFAVRECRPRLCVSLDAPVHGTDGLTLADLLPAAAAAPQGDTDLAAAIADKVLDALSTAHCAVIVARAKGVSLSAPALLAALGIGKSRAFDLWNEVYRKIAAAAGQQMPGEGRAACLAVALAASAILTEKIILRERVEKRLSKYFMGVEGAL